MALVDFRPDPKLQTKLFLITALVALLALAFTAFFAVLIGSDVAGQEGVVVALIIAVLINIVWVIPVLLIIPPYYRSLRYEIHEDEVINYVGVITQSVKHVPFRTVTNLRVSRGPFDRLFGLGTLHIQTAGASGQRAAEETLIGLSNAQAVYEQIGGTLRRFRTGMTPTQAEEEPLPANAELFAAMLGELKAIRQSLEQPRG